MKWTDELTTGIERIDSQHKMLFKLAADFREALDQGHGRRSYALLLESLDRYVRTHFHVEEGCMEQYRCPAALQNKATHAEFMAVLAGFQRRYQDEGFDPSEAHQLVDTIERWLTDHIGRIDVQLRGCVPPA